MFDFDFLVYVYFWLAFSGAVAVAAGGRQRNVAVWFIVALLTTPIVAAAYLFAMPPGREAAEHRSDTDTNWRANRYFGFGTPRGQM
jgi:hypothetical protein